MVSNLFAGRWDSYRQYEWPVAGKPTNQNQLGHTQTSCPTN